MNVVQILVFLGLAGGIGFVRHKELRLWSIFLLSILSVYIFQPLVPLRNFDYWLPTLSIVLTVGVWLVVGGSKPDSRRLNLTSGLVSIFTIIAVSLFRYLPFDIPWFPVSSPMIIQILAVLVATSLFAVALSIAWKGHRPGSWFYLFLLILIFVLVKTEPIAVWISGQLRLLQGQSVALASTLDLNWLGFSYISFRLLHTLRDHHTGRLPSTNLREFVSYVLFFPAVVAGPIDRVERFIEDLGSSTHLSSDRVLPAGQRIVIGLVKKFVLADSLALFALSSQNAELVTSSGWAWLLLYAYSLRLLLDFSGYTDIAIGLGMLVGVQLPENFNRPYQKSNIAAFWNAWHITLAQWFRSYFFNPLTRWLRRGPLNNQTVLIVLIGQVGTMVLIGLWHGITWNFAIWGLWHGIGLFLHNRWVYFTRASESITLIDRLPSSLRQGVATVLTFHFITLGWVWFALPELDLSLNFFRSLLGLSGWTG